jgi:hypothetical protein
VIFGDRFAICLWRWRSERFRGRHSVDHDRLKTERGPLNKPQPQRGFFPFRQRANAV